MIGFYMSCESAHMNFKALFEPERSNNLKMLFAAECC